MQMRVIDIVVTVYEERLIAKANLLILRLCNLY